MRVEFLGSGGAITTPRPLCDCAVCREARAKGPPYSRSGPSVFIHGPDVLIDTPEEIKDQLNRSRVRTIAACFYSHWHPDHVMGRRVFECQKDFHGLPPENRCIPVYVPARVAGDMRRTLGSWEHLEFLQDQGLVRLTELSEGEPVEIGGWTIRPFPLAESWMYAFMVEEGRAGDAPRVGGAAEEGGGKAREVARAGGGRPVEGRGAGAGAASEGPVRLLVAPDELVGWTPPDGVKGVDLAVLPMGVVQFDPFTGERRIPAGHPVLDSEATFEETLDIVRALEARRTLLTHIEEPDGLSYDDLRMLEGRLRDSGVEVGFAYDTLVVDV
jgi:phosphoribosyl 1,2-cyclic phosphate phosphodiesterase